MHSLHSEPQACLVLVIASNCYRKQTEFCYLRLWCDYMQEFKFKTEIFLSYLFTFFFFAINLKLKYIVLIKTCFNYSVHFFQWKILLVYLDQV